ncbi:hypothetical protein [Campylobacter sputorum]|uniref:hypothetical protein n=1 Tax=Campylobacter sputorum TaxID=206 RepID=UPI000B78435D|nr:hypothetical protein [Campylobacter sputorum]ASM37010.1 hypothetical protein CSF_1146 [Campylobacter sputorum bv. faecalis CCUG 20703]
MLNKIIGAVALIAIGYGLKTYADEYGWFDDESDKLDNDDNSAWEKAEDKVDEQDKQVKDSNEGYGI